MREPDWCIVRFRNSDPDRKRDTDLLILREYQWEAQAYAYDHKWEYVARNLKSNEEALKWVSLFKE
jgi:hypothetical protein